MTTLIIGNGFDLNLGLPTTYGDFIKSGEFKSLIENRSLLAMFLNDIYKNQRWVDIENELINYSKKDRINFEAEYKDLVEKLKDYLVKVNQKEVNRESLAYKEILKLKKGSFKVINFNYTNSIQRILIENGFTEDEAENHVIHIHGSISENSIVFGVQDDAEIKPKDIFIKKAFSPSLKSINVNNLLNTTSNAIFFGHSLGNTDHTYFEMFIFSISSPTNRKSKNIKFFYYGENGYKNLMIELDKLSSKQLSWLIQTNKIERIDSNK